MKYVGQFHNGYYYYRPSFRHPTLVAYAAGDIKRRNKPILLVTDSFMCKIPGVDHDASFSILFPPPLDRTS
jgi:hypothetical protein